MNTATQQFGQIFEEHRAEVKRIIARHTSDPDDAQDLAQEVFMRAYSAFEQFQEGTNARAWLYKITLNVCANAARARARYYRHITEQPETCDAPAELTGMLEQLVRQEEQHLIRLAMRCLPADQVLILTLRFSDRLTLPEIAEVLGAPVDTVKSRLRTALGKIQSAYNYMNLGIARMDQPPVVEAVPERELDSVLIPGEHGGKVYHSLGAMYLRKGLIQAALHEWGRAQKAAPTFLDAYLDSAQQYVEISQPIKAVETLETAVSRIRNPDLHVRLAELYLTNLDDIAEGIHHSTHALQMEPEHPQAHYIAGRAYYKQGDRQEEQAMKDGNRHLIEEAIAASWRESSSHLREAVRIQKVFPKASSLLARTYLEENKMELALRESITALNNAPDDEAILYSTGWVHYRANKLPDAESYFRRALAHEPTAGAYGALAFVRLDSDDAQDAYEALQQAIKLPTTKTYQATILANMASFALKLDRPDEAIEHAEKAMRLNPNHIHSYCNLARAHLKMGDSPHIAINICKQGLRVHSIHICFPRIMAEAYYRLEQYDEALAQITEAVEREPQEAQWWLLRAKILIRMNQFDRARQDVREALNRKPESKDAKDMMRQIDEAETACSSAEKRAV